ncbi:MAG TPA: 50S ribosomal protein L3 [Candidatus Paceibacterota bacterium]|nr:50S ribosomal protein L3 [Candidatus Paceibacterota bacterium]
MFILGKKVKMTQVWKDKRVLPVTIIEARPNTVTLVRNEKRDGYDAVQLSLGRTKRETRKHPLDMKVGDTVKVSIFAEGDVVSVSGLNKGRGFQGGVKRHGFHGGPKTHGQKNRFRAPGSIGSTAPQRVLPGRRMAGHMGQERVTVRNLKIVGVDAEKDLLMIRGAVPGARGTVLEITKK